MGGAGVTAWPPQRPPAGSLSETVSDLEISSLVVVVVLVDNPGTFSDFVNVSS